MTDSEASDILRESRGETRKVYIVIETDDWNSAWVKAVYSSREAAQAHLDAVKNRDWFSIEDYPLDDEYVPPPEPTREELRQLGRKPLPYEKDPDGGMDGPDSY